MKKLKLNIWQIVGFIFIILHLIYAFFMLTQSFIYGILWFIIAFIEILVFIIGCKKFHFLNIILAIILILQVTTSFVIMGMGTNRNTKNCDYVLVLGYQLDHDQMSETLRLRLDKAYQYASNNPQSQLILCGGITRENTISEAQVMQDYLIQKGLDQKRIIIEDQSTDTIENITNSLQYIDNDANILVISSNYHVYRAKMICSKVGIEAKGLGSSAPLLLIPNQLLFEKLGIIKMWIQM